MPSLLLLIFLFLGSNDAKKTFNLYKGETLLKMESLQTLELFWHHTEKEIFKNGSDHGLRTPNEGTNQRYLKNWADVADKICFGHINLELGFDFRPCSEGDFLTGRP